MRLSELLTTRASERDGATDLLVRAGYTHRLGDGLYTLLPLARRVLAKMEAIFRREMERAGAHEITMPLLQPAELWDRRAGTGETRAEAFGSQLFRLAEGAGNPLVLSPTHEEVAALVGNACIGDARDLPRVAYQIQPRFRNQTCPPEHGLLHTREFVMADAYGFHADRASVDGTYLAMREAFSAVVANCGADARWVDADAGAMGGEASEELIAPIPTMKSTAAVFCDACGYAASAEIAEFSRPRPTGVAHAPMEEVAAAEVPDENRLVWIPFLVGLQVVLGVMPRGYLLSPVKLARALSRAKLASKRLHANPATARELGELGLTYDSISLVRTPASVTIVADEALLSGANFSIPSARAGSLLTNVNPPRDFRVDLFADICSADEGTLCVRCGAALRAARGVEVGHIFKLGARYLNELGSGATARPIEMSCYGLGLTRLMATVVEQRSDASGIVWPDGIAPFAAAVVPASAEASPAALQLYRTLSASGIDVLLDDSPAPLAEKTAYLELLGIPLQIVTSGETVALRERASSSVQHVHTTDVGGAMLERAASSGRPRTA